MCAGVSHSLHHAMFDLEADCWNGVRRSVFQTLWLNFLFIIFCTCEQFYYQTTLLQGCRGFLEDTIINFRDHLEEAVLDKAMDEASISDTILCLGTTLTVTPACDIVEMAPGKQPLIICNRSGATDPVFLIFTVLWLGLCHCCYWWW